MARIRLSGGIVLPGTHTVWLAADPGDEVDGTRPFPGAPVVVGPAAAGRSDVARARREAARLIAGGGPLVAGAGIDVGRGFRTARLEGGGDARRDAVLAALELLGPEGVARIGTRDSVLVALFGTRATKRVGAAALDVLAGDRRSGLRLAVAASDVLGPEQLEQVLRFDAPPGVEPVPRGTSGLLGTQMTTLLTPYAARRRLTLVRSLWDEVVDWHRSSAAWARARRRRYSVARRDALLAQVRRADDRWWRQEAERDLGRQPNEARMLAWMAGPDVRRRALQRAFHECVAATALLRTALAAEERTAADAVLANLDQLAYSATAHVDLDDRVGSLHRASPPSGVAAARAWNVSSSVVLASEPGDILAAEGTARLRVSLRHACEVAHAVLLSTVDLANAMRAEPASDAEPGVTREWRRLAGFSARRPPDQWRGGLTEVDPLAQRIEEDAGHDPVTIERLEDGLWLAELADLVASWFGHDLAGVHVGGDVSVDFDPDGPATEPGVPSRESVPLAVAGAAQLVALGAEPAPRPATWCALTAGLLAGAERLGLNAKLLVPGEVAGWEGRDLPGTDLRVEVARTPLQLTEWGNDMGNCIASYAEDADHRFALVALRRPDGKLVANISIQRPGARWAVEQALGRFNELLLSELEEQIRAWAHHLRGPETEGHRRPRPPTPYAHRRPARRRHRRPPSRQALLRASADLGGVIGDLETDRRVERARPAVGPVAAEQGWSGDTADWLGPFVAVARLRSPDAVAHATGRALDAGLRLSGLWEATALRPLSDGVERLGDHEPSLRRLADWAVPPSLRLALGDARISSARAVELAARRIRAALFELLAAGDPRLDRAVIGGPHAGFVTAAVLALTASSDGPRERFEWIPVSSAGAVPGRPPTFLTAGGGPWVAARPVAVEAGVAPARLDEVLADAPGRHLLVPAAWTSAKGWSAFWGRAHRVTNEARRRPAAAA